MTDQQTTHTQPFNGHFGDFNRMRPFSPIESRISFLSNIVGSINQLNTDDLLYVKDHIEGLIDYVTNEQSNETDNSNETDHSNETDNSNETDKSNKTDESNKTNVTTFQSIAANNISLIDIQSEQKSEQKIPEKITFVFKKNDEPSRHLDEQDEFHFAKLIVDSDGKKSAKLEDDDSIGYFPKNFTCPGKNDDVIRVTIKSIKDDKTILNFMNIHFEAGDIVEGIFQNGKNSPFVNIDGIKLGKFPSNFIHPNLQHGDKISCKIFTTFDYKNNDNKICGLGAMLSFLNKIE